MLVHQAAEPHFRLRAVLVFHAEGVLVLAINASGTEKDDDVMAMRPMVRALFVSLLTPPGGRLLRQGRTSKHRR